MRTLQAKVIKLKHYKQPDYRVETVDLDISLDSAKTRVRSVLNIKRNKNTSASKPLKLDGDGFDWVFQRVNFQDSK